jgi:hypothetical protein
MDTIAPYECLVIDNVTESLYLYKAPHASWMYSASKCVWYLE